MERYSNLLSRLEKFEHEIDSLDDDGLLSQSSTRISDDVSVTTHTTARYPTSRRCSPSMNEIPEASNPELQAFQYLGYTADLQSSTLMKKAKEKVPHNILLKWTEYTVTSIETPATLVEFQKWLEVQAHVYDKINRETFQQNNFRRHNFNSPGNMNNRDSHERNLSTQRSGFPAQPTNRNQSTTISSSGTPKPPRAPPFPPLNNANQPKRSCEKCRGNHILATCPDYQTCSPSQRFDIRANLNNSNQSFSVNHLQSTPKEWFEQLQLIPVSFLNGKKAFDTYALIDPGSQFTFILDKITEFLALPCEDQKATTLQYLNTEHDMPLSKISEQVTVAPYENLDQKFQITTTYSTPCLNVAPANTFELNQLSDAFKELRHIHFLEIAEGKIGALLGINTFAFTHPVEVIPATKNQPFGVKTRLGWTLAGEYERVQKQHKQRSHQQKQYVYHVSRRSSDDQPLDELLEQFWKIEAEGTQPKHETTNPVDKEALDILNKTISYNGERYEIGLPWKKPLRIENNYFAALSQLKSLQKRLSKDLQLKELYEQTLTTDLRKFYVKPVEMQQPEPEKIWYLPHHPVVNPNKPGKVRRVANAAAKFRGQSLNSNLITGPDSLNNLVGILLRFRENPVAILSDVEGMFMQIAIRHEDQSALRFLWPNEEMVNQYQFTRLIFGATCSPFCAIFVLNRCAEDNAIEFPKAVNAIKNHFYMDDYIHSLPSIEKAIDTINQTKDSLHKGVFRLTKLVSNKHEALRFIEQEDRDELKEINGVLGQKWNTRTDCFRMKTLEHFPGNASEYTQRKMFSLVSTIFDPLGILSPLTIRIKMLLQQVWKLGKKWDEPLPAELHSNLQKSAR
ncbi:uncharacterized protein LOC142340448 [Convolutriloba macropyga]|uniref:uncharacterized protein LOC142340448 n=1 Tax=Convolutriloba macropyga TaxID=536237 RepID=UPI003F5234D6